jgi:hydrogenase-4 component H
VIGSKIKEVLIAIRGGKVTLGYPLAPAPPLPEGFRGKVEFNADRCIGCGGCANVCPARCLVLKDLGQNKRQIMLLRERCTHCGRCQEVCPERAITLAPEFELATNNKADITDRLELYMASCGRCGRCFKPMTPLDKMMVTGMRE